MNHDNVWIMIPARGGSRGLPRKNVRLLGGRPLIRHVIDACLQAVPAEQIIVVTDDDEIDAIATEASVRVMREEQTTGKATLDDVAAKVLPLLRSLGSAEGDIFLTVQPTCPLIKSDRITQAVEKFRDGAGSVVTVVDDRHLGWQIDEAGSPTPDYEARVNRQMLPPQYRETGAVIGCRIRELAAQGTRIIEPIHLLEVSKQEALDIDTFADWVVAEYFIGRRDIVIRADAGKKLGMGHVFRALALAQEFAQHRVRIVTEKAEAIAFGLLSQSPFDVVQVDGNRGFLAWLQDNPADLVILDQLDTDVPYVRAVKAHCHRVVTFEDLGDGAMEADLVVSDLYKNLNVPDARQLSGLSNAILAPNFETITGAAPFRETVENILVLFGGTDPSQLTEKTLAALRDVNYGGQCTVVIGPGFGRPLALDDYGLKGTIHQNLKFMPAVMRSADLAISSAGRTITELVSLGVPVLCMCQNSKELTHTHASARFGVVSIGMGSLAGPGTISAHIQTLIDTPDLRRLLRERGLHETAGRSNKAIVSRMLERLDF
ncbi:cytidylyltransferase domain-containing protein [Roseobacter litoralis]|uniref:cytidylyltransferase domain-containing protein n=1 Tax=Roseobacter litoralis TaxID=42443 RepID=UPI00249018AB|nr:NTP transferase domain-containing protein [Roseobacter litoralis]